MSAVPMAPQALHDPVVGSMRDSWFRGNLVPISERILHQRFLDCLVSALACDTPMDTFLDEGGPLCVNSQQ